jgi:serine palmitoyltransferase
VCLARHPSALTHRPRWHLRTPCSLHPFVFLTLPPHPQGYAPLLQDWENFFTRRIYHRIQDCWNRPIAGPPFAGKLDVVMRTTPDGVTYT